MNVRIGLLLAIALFTPTAHASQGAFEINQTCAVETGCFAGDAPGFPVSIQNPGNYLLTSDLDLSNLGAVDIDGIEVATSQATIDLGGFAIHGNGICTFSAGPNSGGATCSNGSGRDGIRVFTPAFTDGTRIRNGTIRGMRGNGISLFHDTHVISDLLIYENGGDGIFLGTSVPDSPAAMIRDCVIHTNGDDGIHARGGSVIESTVVRGNDQAGVRLEGPGGYVRDTTALENGRFGFHLDEGSKYGPGNFGYRYANSCGGRRCSEKPRLIRSAASVSSSEAFEACPDGFHLPEFWEIVNPGLLDVDGAADGGWIATSGSFGSGPRRLFLTLSANAGGGGLPLTFAPLLVSAHPYLTVYTNSMDSSGDWGGGATSRSSPWHALNLSGVQRALCLEDH